MGRTFRRTGFTTGADELRMHVRGQLAGYTVPDTIEILEKLSRTSTGKIQKFALRERAWANEEFRVKG